MPSQIKLCSRWERTVRRPAKPVERTAVGDERGRTAVSNGSVILNFRNVRDPAMTPELFTDFDKTDVTAAFDARHFYFRQIFGFRFEPHVFLEIMFGNVVP